MESNNFPKPPPDRRKNPISPIENNKNEEKNQTQSKIYQVLKKNVSEIRDSLSEFKILKKDCVSNPKMSEFIPDNLNIILFGPSGSGKSSLIKFFTSFLIKLN